MLKAPILSCIKSMSCIDCYRFLLLLFLNRFIIVMMSQGFKINECNKCVYVKDTKHGYVIVCVYVLSTVMIR